MRIWSKFVDFLLYSNVWIAGAAASLYVYSNYAFTQVLTVDYTALFVFFTCVWLYSLHRYIGLQKVKTLRKEDRFYKIQELQKLIIGIGSVSLVLSGILAFTLSWSQILVLAIPGVLSMLYVLPVFKNNRRLRDISYIKIFVISLVWATLTIAIPLKASHDYSLQNVQLLLFLERFIFIFAITLPFDIRDLEVDAQQNVKTISAKIGTQNTWLLCLTLLTISSAIIVYINASSSLTHPLIWIHLVTNFITLALILLAFWRQHDWYYTGFLDGTMYLPLLFLITYLFSIG